MWLSLKADLEKKYIKYLTRLDTAVRSILETNRKLIFENEENKVRYFGSNHLTLPYMLKEAPLILA